MVTSTLIRSIACGVKQDLPIPAEDVQEQIQTEIISTIGRNQEQALTPVQLFMEVERHLPSPRPGPWLT